MKDAWVLEDRNNERFLEAGCTEGRLGSESNERSMFIRLGFVAFATVWILEAGGEMMIGGAQPSFRGGFFAGARPEEVHR